MRKRDFEKITINIIDAEINTQCNRLEKEDDVFINGRIENNMEIDIKRIKRI